MHADSSAVADTLCALALVATLGLPLTVSGAGEPSWSQEELGKAARAEQEIDPGVQEAIDRGDLKTLRVLLKKLNYYKDEPQIKVYAFQVAVSLGNVAVVEYLAGLGWLDECRKPNPAGCELVPFAAQHGRIGMIKWLMSQGFDVKDINSYGWTALHSAAQKGHLETVKFLCAQGVDDKAKAGGDTALELAKKSHRGPVVKYLESGQCGKK